MALLWRLPQAGVFALSEGPFWMKEGPDALPGRPPRSHCREAVAFALPRRHGADSCSLEGAASRGVGKVQTRGTGTVVAVTLGLALTGREPSPHHPTPLALVYLSAHPGQEDGTCLAQG